MFSKITSREKRVSHGHNRTTRVGFKSPLPSFDSLIYLAIMTNWKLLEQNQNWSKVYEENKTQSLGRCNVLLNQMWENCGQQNTLMRPAPNFLFLGCDPQVQLDSPPLF